MIESEKSEPSPEEKATQAIHELQSELNRKSESDNYSLDSDRIINSLITLSEYVIDNDGTKQARALYDSYKREGKKQNDGTYNSLVAEVHNLNNAIIGGSGIEMVYLPGGEGLVRVDIGLDRESKPSIKLSGSGRDENIERKAEKIGIKDPNKRLRN